MPQGSSSVHTGQGDITVSLNCHDSLDDFGDDCIDTSITDSLDFSKSDIIFIDSDGEQTTDDALSSSSSYALCTHIMADSAFYTHAKNADIEQMQFFKVHTHMLNVLIDIN